MCVFIKTLSVAPACDFVPFPFQQYGTLNLMMCHFVSVRRCVCVCVCVCACVCVCVCVCTHAHMCACTCGRMYSILGFFSDFNSFILVSCVCVCVWGGGEGSWVGIYMCVCLSMYFCPFVSMNFSTHVHVDCSAFCVFMNSCLLLLQTIPILSLLLKDCF